MKIVDCIGEVALGVPVPYIHLIPDEPSDCFLVFLHGAGETGTVDGAQIRDLEIHGPVMHAKRGFNYKFNIIAPQVQNDHKNLMKVFPAYIKLKYNARVIIVTGLSLGGYGTYDAALNDKLGLIYAYAPVCGAGRPTLIEGYPSNMRMWHFHGDADTTVKWSTARAFINLYNSLNPESQIKTTIYPGINHNSWSKAYSVTPGQDELLQQFNKWFDEAPKQTNLDDMKNKVIDFVKNLN
jgi:predicted peptidase